MDLVHVAYALAPIAIIYLLSTSRQSDGEAFSSAYRAVLAIMLVGVLIILVPHVRAYANLVINTTRESHKTTAQLNKLNKLSAADLQAEYLRARIVTPNAGLRCTQAERDWDYVCSYMPTPFKSKTRLAFGVIVDETRVVKTSRPVPEGTNLPPSQ